MRTHLYACLKDNKITPFSKILKMPKMPSKEDKLETIRLYCTCRLPGYVDDMVKCENYMCKTGWFHKQCVKYTSACLGKKWFCRNCAW